MLMGVKSMKSASISPFTQDCGPTSQVPQTKTKIKIKTEICSFEAGLVVRPKSQTTSLQITCFLETRVISCSDVIMCACVNRV